MTASITIINDSNRGDRVKVSVRGTPLKDLKPGEWLRHGVMPEKSGGLDLHLESTEGESGHEYEEWKVTAHRTNAYAQNEGQYRVGLDFNPSGDPKVIALKQAAAHFIELCYQYNCELFGDGADIGTPLCALDTEKQELYERAMRDAEGAAMFAVKAATKREKAGVK